MQRRRAARIATGWLLLCLLAGDRAPAVEAEALFLREPDLVCVARTENLDAADAWITALLREIQPRTDRAGLLRREVGRLLRNPDLREVPGGAFLELCLFDTGGRPPQAVWIFPVADPEEYRRLLGDRPGFREEAASGEIAVFRDGAGETAPRRYLAFTRDGNALFGSTRDTVAAIRRLYDEGGQEGLLAPLGGAETFRATVALERVLLAERAGLERAYARLVEDTAEAIAPPAAAPAAETVPALRRAAEAVDGLLLQCGRTRVTVDLTPAGVRMALRSRTEAGQILNHILAAAPDAGGRTDPEPPGDAVSWRRVRLWPALWRQTLEGAGAVLAARLGEGLDDGTRAAFRGLLGGLEPVEPRLYEAGVLLPEEGPPLLARRLRVRNGPAFAALLRDGWALLAGPGMADALDRVGWRLEAALSEGEDGDAGEVRRLDWSLRPVGDEGNGPEADVIGPPRTAWLGRSGATFAAVVPLGVDPEEAGAAAPGALAALGALLAAPPQTGGGRGPEPAPFLTGRLRPSGYARAALGLGGFRGGFTTDGETDRWRRRAPVVYSVAAEAGTFHLELHVPRGTAVDFGRSLLGTGGVERIARR